ncbi:von Willebrand factor A domain-containing protein 8 isoform X2 [Cimex lectularius]|uniref:von Willebrand factor A domain-containing protein 8 n=1 Tax=Cimex lectularius TaxID=79782 RepID=A0A8I6TH21_CIMLE|nr:von Willebrand factor A domain-containing protein 8 isoform X2 [Cimex lectularius]
MYLIGENSVSIGDVRKTVKPTKNPQYVPRSYLLKEPDQETLHHLRWMLQKDMLSQDIFLVGRPGPLKRRLAMQFLELTERELEFVSLSRDTTEADLKQRREIESGTAKYIDQSAVRAALEGRILVLEGIEKAERNVLPVLNNLLENREMHLEDGRFLIPAKRFDKLLEEHGKEELDKWKLVRVSEDFRVVALGLPVPGYQGNPLDPPLRSRFQARDIPSTSYQDLLKRLSTEYRNVPQDKLTTLLSCAYALISPEATSLGLPDFPIENIHFGTKLMELFPWLNVGDVLSRLYPGNYMLNKDGLASVKAILDTFKVGAPCLETRVNEVVCSLEGAKATLHSNGLNTSVQLNCGPGLSEDLVNFVRTPYHDNFLAGLTESHVAGDFCIIGPRGCGKSLSALRFAKLLGYTVEPIVLYQDMTSRDLIQQRATLENGDTYWKNSPLVSAALEGKLAILDGLHRVHPSTLSILHRLVQDRELQLHDGKRLIKHNRYDELVQKYGQDIIDASGYLKIHPSFRIIALAEPNSPNTIPWLNPELLSLFIYHEMRPMTIEEEVHIIKSIHKKVPRSVQKVLEISHSLRQSSEPMLLSLASSLSTRQLLRISQRAVNYEENDAYSVIQRACLAKFLPPLAKQTLDTILSRAGLVESSLEDNLNKKITVNDNTVTVGNTTAPIFQTTATSKVPDILFYDVPQHVGLLERLMQDFILGEHLLLVGNQGVGKNKLADKLLQLLNKPREYIQLHRDTTVQSLTLQPTVKNGVVSYEDSPLVVAVKNGHALVVDEADKAPTHVTCILKTLVESGEMILSDGRRIVSNKDPRAAMEIDGIIPIHPDFRMIVLANRPGFPFLGNDFFGALGDLFSCHSVDNPSRDSEIELLKNYGPNVPADIVHKLVGAFGKLRIMADQGLVAYPYSTRELVNIIKHLQAFPEDSLSEAVGNVFDFDRYSSDAKETLLDVLSEYNIPVAMTTEERAKNRKRVQMTIDKDSGKDVSSPKHGKVDEKNEPHVGGNTWAGGTGGRDTAGLGGKGGPYRLDAGHDVTQISDEEKAAVPEHIKKAAREMGQKAFKAKLEEIKMSAYDANLYEEFLLSVSKQVQALRVILSSLQAKSKERQWQRHQTTGELDDTKLIEGVTGEKNIYRRRTDKEPEVGSPQLKPKRLKLVVDVSGSMYRFNGYDGRMDRQLEAVVMVMEAFKGYESKFQYDIVGHSGESPSISFIEKTNPPPDNKQRLAVIRTMHAHSQFCMSGDYTLEATEDAIKSLAKEDCDEAIVIVLSDANLRRYAIPVKELSQSLICDPRVEAYIIFIGSLGNEAERLKNALPAGKGYLCLDLKNLPQILQTIFTSSMLKS